jgi:RHS repeat-associated protein
LALAKNVDRVKTGQAESHSNALNIPSISLPKGGGAIRGIGEKFAANPVTGTGSMTVPIATSPGRSGFGPQLSLSYDSGSGNGPFGFGWNLSLPCITRKTDKGLPQYRDAEGSDVFILSGAEDLVPVFKQDEAGSWINNPDGSHKLDEDSRDGYLVKRYRPRVEGLFARIERWTNQSDPTDIFWRSISKDNILTIYGKDENSRIASQDDAGHIFSWLISETRDDKGNAVVYRYKPEDACNVDLSQAHEQNRTDIQRKTNRYIQHIYYGNRIPLLDSSGIRPGMISKDTLDQAEWMFEVLFDYGEGHYCQLTRAGQDPQYVLAQLNLPESAYWPVRKDPFSSYRPGFEVRTYRLCRRVLMFHHFLAELSVNDYLVRSSDFTYDETQVASYLTTVTQSGYLLQPDQDHPILARPNQPNRFFQKSLPPITFTYSRVPDDSQLSHLPVQTIDRDSLENLPYGLDGKVYQWIDLNGEGLAGILTEQAGAWYYKPNQGEGKFGPIQVVASLPSLAALNAGRQQMLDLAGDGQLDLVDFHAPTPGFFERTEDENWDAFQAFPRLPNLDWGDPNLRFVDLNGDGHADVLITEEDVFTWYPSLAKDGFGEAEFVHQPPDDEKGPRLVFADGEQSISLADLSGDGMSDLVRIRNGEVCYWPNLGYGQFGAKVTMDNSPWFDAPDQFNHSRVRLADIDGSGTTDIVYLAANGVQLYFNQCGNGWSDPVSLPQFPSTNDLTTVQVIDLLGSGTACLVWASPLPGDLNQPMVFIDLMGGQKPHLLVNTDNNLGATTCIEYASSTKFYLQDKIRGTPWVTRLPFPVYCVEKVTTSDNWRKTNYISSYSYHHGYYDGIEGEFRGFGRVEQVDAEDYGTFAAGNTGSPYITNDRGLYQPPVKTVTWYHTGAMLDRQRILSHYQDEYFPKWFEDVQPGQQVLGKFCENALPEPDLDALDLSADEWREALRACKGMLLRQEIYELDVDALVNGTQKPVKLFSTAYHNCHIHNVQPKFTNLHTVFHVTESEAITYHYELDLRGDTVAPDPRIVHSLNLKIDEVGNVQQSVSVVYPRIVVYQDSSLQSDDLALIKSMQNDPRMALHLAYTENRYVEKDIEEDDYYRLHTPCEVRTYELTGIFPGGNDGPVVTDHAWKNQYFTLEELRSYHLSDYYLPQAGDVAVKELLYHQNPNRSTPQKRLVEHTCTLYFENDLSGPASLYKFGRMGLVYEQYKLALTDDLLADIFGDKLDDLIAGTTAREKFGTANTSGYLDGKDARFAPDNFTGQYWMRTGVAGFAANAAQHFYLPERYEDPFGNITTLIYDNNYDLFIQSSTDPLDNTTAVTQFDFRVLAPVEIEDSNGNLSDALFDSLGMVVAVALTGKGEEGDNLKGFNDSLANLAWDELDAFFNGISINDADARKWLGNATTRFIYYLGESIDAEGKVTWENHPAGACTVLREKHCSQLATGEQADLQLAFEYSDGLGAVLTKKIQAEPAPGQTGLRWITNGKTVLNNKGKPVKQYEPYFSAGGFCFEEPGEEGVTPLMYYDAIGRLVRTELPDGSLSRVEFSAWQVLTFDQNDTVTESQWYSDRRPPNPDAPLPVNPLTQELMVTPDQRAAWLAAQHRDTPNLTILDSLGREAMAVSHNRFTDASGQLQDEKYVTFKQLDAEGKPLWIRDARHNLVMRYTVPCEPAKDATVDFYPAYDIAGNLLFQHSMDAGERWMLNDAAGKPMLAWDSNQFQDETGKVALQKRIFFSEYDALHRPAKQWLSIDGGDARLVEYFVYGEDAAAPVDAQCNLRGQVYRHYDPSGLTENTRFDFKGNLHEQHRRLARDGKAAVLDWQANQAASAWDTGLEADTFVQITEVDALNRMTRLYNWHQGPGSRVTVYEPAYNPRGLLASEVLIVRASKTDSGYDKVQSSAGVIGSQIKPAIQEIRYNAKGQKELVETGNGTISRYDYNPQTFRLCQLRTSRPDYDPPFPSQHSGLKDNQVLQQLNYTYDAVGNITEIYDEAYEPVFFQQQRVEPRSRYEYDALYRLVKASGRQNAAVNSPPVQFENKFTLANFPLPAGSLANYSETYQYDEVGNFKQMRHSVLSNGSWTRNFETASGSNQLQHTWDGTSRASAVVTDYRYDTHGSLLNLASVDPSDQMRWDFRDMLHGLNLQGGGWAYYAYDSSRQRTRKRLERQGGTVDERIYLGGFELFRSYDAAKNVTEEIESQHVFLGDQRILLVEDIIATDEPSMPTGPLYRYQYNNYLGSACVELDGAAGIISYEEYYPYGTSAYTTMRSGIEAPNKRYRYTGKERDEESGLYYHGARYYVPWMGRWIQADPTGIKNGSNIFAYVSNNPINLVDLNGKAELSPDRIVSDVTSAAGDRKFFHVIDWRGWAREGEELSMVGMQMADIQVEGLRPTSAGSLGQFGSGVYTYPTEAPAASLANGARRPYIEFNVEPSTPVRDILISQGSEIKHYSLIAPDATKNLNLLNLRFKNVSPLQAQTYFQFLKDKPPANFEIPIKRQNLTPDVENSPVSVPTTEAQEAQSPAFEANPQVSRFGGALRTFGRILGTVGGIVLTAFSLWNLSKDVETKDIPNGVIDTLGSGGGLTSLGSRLTFAMGMTQTTTVLATISELSLILAIPAVEIKGLIQATNFAAEKEVEMNKTFENAAGLGVIGF